jgi:hypothetical protein
LLPNLPALHGAKGVSWYHLAKEIPDEICSLGEHGPGVVQSSLVAVAKPKCQNVRCRLPFHPSAWIANCPYSFQNVSFRLVSTLQAFNAYE